MQICFLCTFFDIFDTDGEKYYFYYIGIIDEYIAFIYAGSNVENMIKNK